MPPVTTNIIESSIQTPEGKVLVRYTPNSSKSKTKKKKKKTQKKTPPPIKHVQIRPDPEEGYELKRKKRLTSKSSYEQQRLPSPDIFISYRRVEDERGIAPEWITNFVDDFLSEIKTVPGFSHFQYKKNLWFDRKYFKKAENVMEDICMSLSKTKVFIGLVTPSYFDSQNCTHEWETFHEHNQFKNNFYMVPIRPVVHEELPKPVQDVSRDHHFCYNKTPHELTGPIRKNHHSLDYAERLEELVKNVASSLNDINNNPKARN